VKKFWKNGRGQGHVTPNFWVLNADSSNMAEDTIFIFGGHAPRQSRDMIPENSRKGGIARVT